MNQSTTGQFYGSTNQTIHLDGLTLTDTVYTHPKVDWHYHENNYFTFLLQGSMLEGNKKHTYECFAGDLLYHNWEDPHYNEGSKEFTRGFHLELSNDWFQRFDLDKTTAEGSIKILDPTIKAIMYNIFKEAKLSAETGQPGIDALLATLFSRLGGAAESPAGKKPVWVARLREMLHEAPASVSTAALKPGQTIGPGIPIPAASIAGQAPSLRDLARQLGIHPVHLSREFPRHFHTTLGRYIRLQKLNRALALLPAFDRSLTDIALEAGFADQSHFIRCFQSDIKISPLQYRKLLQKGKNVKSVLFPQAEQS